MKSDWKPFTKPTKNRESTGKLDAAMVICRDLERLPAGETFTDFARGFGVNPHALRWRLKQEGIDGRFCVVPRPDIRRGETGAKKGKKMHDHTNTSLSSDNEATTVREGEKEGTGCNLQGDCVKETDLPGKMHDMQPELHQIQTSEPCILHDMQVDCVKPSTPAVQAPSRNEIAVLSDSEIDRHDAEIAELARESVAAFRAGKSKGPKGKRVLPVTKVSDVTALDTLFRRATRQGEREGKGAGGNLISIQFLGGVSRESVRVARDETSPIVDIQGEEPDL